jgi:hypothetical protein
MAKISAVPPTIRRYLIPAKILRDSAEQLRTLAGGRKESVVLWQGKVRDAVTAEITGLVIPRQVTGPYHFNIPLSERLALIEKVAEAGEFILIQLHTHPRQAFHSPADDQMAITKHQGAVSIVVPNFGRDWHGDFVDTTVHMNLGGARWRQLPPTEIAQLLEVVP